MSTKRKRLTVRIDLESAAFADEFGDLELNAVLRTLAQTIGAGALNGKDGPLSVGYAVPISDSNGVRVGLAEVVLS